MCLPSAQFAFPKGQAFYITRGLARIVAGSTALQSHAEMLQVHEQVRSRLGTRPRTRSAHTPLAHASPVPSPCTPQAKDASRCFLQGPTHGAWVRMLTDTVREKRRKPTVRATPVGANSASPLRTAFERWVEAESKRLGSTNATTDASTMSLGCDGRRNVQPPWEDVWLGLAVAQMRMAGESAGETPSREATNAPAQGVGRLPHSMAEIQADSTLATPITFVSFRDPMFIDAHGLFASESTISWHCRMCVAWGSTPDSTARKEPACCLASQASLTNLGIDEL